MTAPRPRARRVVALLLALGVSLGAATARADPVHFRIQPQISELTFKATSLLMNADGKFHRFAGEVVVDPADLATTRVTLSVEAASIDTGIERRDNHLRSEDFFHVERFPTVTFESRRVEPGGRSVTVIGQLTIRGLTRELAVPVHVELGEGVLVARGEFTIERSSYGIRYQSFFNPIGDAVRVAFVFRGRAGPR